VEKVMLVEGFELFRLDLKARRCTQSTQTFYGWYLPLFIRWCKSQQVEYLHEVTQTLVKRYLVDLQERDFADYTQLAAARAVRAWLKFCAREELIAQAPVVTMPAVDEDIMPALSTADIRALWPATKTPLERAVMLLLLDTGIRAFELVALDYGDIDFATGEVQVRRGKGKKGRIVYIGAKTLKHLRRYLMRRGQSGPDDPLFLARDNSKKRLGISGLTKMIRALGKRAGISPCTCHMFRRTFALESLRSGMNVFILQRLMGHKDLKVLLHYLALVEQDLKKAHDLHGVVNNLLP
jgi:integrase/recombinase XerD